MPGEATNKGADIALDAMSGRVTQNARTTYLMLLTALPATPDTATGANYVAVEVTTAGYARQAVTWGAPAGDPRNTSNTVQITFGPFTANPPNAAAAALCNLASGTPTEMIFNWTLDQAKDAEINESILFAIGALVMQGD